MTSDQPAGSDPAINVVIADDHMIVRAAIRAILEGQGGEFRVVGEASDVPSMLSAVEAHRPELLTLDMAMPGGPGLAALKSCFVAHPTVAVAVLTMRDEPDYARHAIKAGACCYIPKDAEPADLLKAFRMAVAGERYLHPRIGAAMASGDGDDSLVTALSSREREVVSLLAAGLTNPEIAERLDVAERTVKVYRARAIEKLGVSSRAEITAYARRTGLAD